MSEGKKLQQGPRTAPGATGFGVGDVVGGDGLDPPGGAIDLDQLAHELRTPLAAIQSMADALAGGHLGAVDPRHAAYLASIRDTARHALAVLHATLSLAASESPGVRPPCARLDLAALAGGVVSSLGMLAARAGVRLEMRSATLATVAFARATEVRQMLTNLVSNGIAHAGGGASVAVVVGAADGTGAWFEVADDGPGIPVGVLRRLEAGEPLDGMTDATCVGRARLGLALTRSLAEANGGRLEIETGPSGTRARVTLPAPPA